MDGIPEAGEENAVNTAGGGSPYDGSSAEKDYSDTNNQVEGVQEADIIKTDGEYIYAAVDGDVYLLRENGGNPEILSKIEKIDTVSEEGENICCLLYTSPHIQFFLP